MSRIHLLLISTAALVAPTAAVAGKKVPRIGHWFPRRLDDEIMPVLITCVAALAVMALLRQAHLRTKRGSTAWRIVSRLRIVTTVIALGAGGIFVADRMQQDAQGAQVAATSDVRQTAGGAKFVTARTPD